MRCIIADIQTQSKGDPLSCIILDENTVKSVDKKRLQELYTVDGEKLIKPKQQAKYLGIDEFKLHNGRRYAAHIIDLETGHIL